MLAITDPVTGDRVIWRGGTVIRAYDRRARLISTIDLDPQPGERPPEPRAAMRSLARSLSHRRRGLRRARLQR